MQKYYVLTKSGGEPLKRPFKEWFRSTQGVENSGLMTTHQMRNHMKRLGWSVSSVGSEVLVVEPGAEVRASNLGPEIHDSSSDESETAESSLFALESHLRDFLARNLNSTIRLPRKLSVVGVEYSTGVGPIDLLASDSDGRYYVFELKLDRGPDAALGQLLRYMGWCKENLPDHPDVHGVILAADISDKLRYAASVVPNVTLMEYELQITVRSVGKPQG